MKKRILSIILLGLCFIGLAFLVITEKTSVFDNAIYNLFIQNNFMDIFMRLITNMGSFIIIFIISIWLLLVFKNKRLGAIVPIGILGMAIINYGIKNIVRRTRPIGIAIINETGFSFPSGHTTTAVVFYGLLMYIIINKVKNKNIKIISCSILSLLIFLIAISRIYLGVHYATDVIGGILLSSIYLIIFITLIRKYYFK